MLSRPSLEYNGQTKELNADEKAVLMRELAEIITGAGFLRDQVKTGQVDKELAYNILSVHESRTAEICKALDVELDSKNSREQRYAALREANTRIRALEQQIGASGTVAQTEKHLEFIARRLDRWWDELGFGHISEMSFTKYGNLQAKFSCHLFGTRALTGSKTPVSDEQNHKSWLESLQERGFELVTLPGDHEPSLLDTQSNREALQELFLTSFQGAQLTQTSNHYDNSGVPVLRDVTVFFRNLQSVADVELLDEAA